MAGGTVVLMERFDPNETLRLITEHRATLFEGVPAMYAMHKLDARNRAQLITNARTQGLL